MGLPPKDVAAALLKMSLGNRTVVLLTISPQERTAALMAMPPEKMEETLNDISPEDREAERANMEAARKKSNWESGECSMQTRRAKGKGSGVNITDISDLPDSDAIETVLDGDSLSSEDIDAGSRQLNRTTWCQPIPHGFKTNLRLITAVWFQADEGS